jgi:hypothetical protein
LTIWQILITIAKILSNGLITAIIVFGITTFFSWRKELKRYRNLLALVALELYYNYYAFCNYEQHFSNIPMKIRTGDWEKVKVEIVSKLPSELVHELASQYYSLEEFNGKVIHDLIIAKAPYTVIKDLTLCLADKVKKLSKCDLREFEETKILKLHQEP